ncbi:MAG: ABC transporter ATP-binding protein [Acidimicrobiales bacterium]
MISAFRNFGRFVLPYRAVLVFGGLLAVVEVAVSLAEPWPLSWVVDRVLRAERPLSMSHANSVLLLAVGALLVLVGLAAVFDYWATRLLSSTGLRLANDLRETLFAHLQGLSLRFHGEHRVGDLAARITGDIDRIQDMLVSALAVLLPNALLVLGMFTVMVVLDPIFTLLALLVTPVMALVIYRATVALKAASRRGRKADGQVAATATESLAAIHLVQAFAMEGAQQDRFGSVNRLSLEAGLETVRLQARFSPVVEVTSALSTGLVLWFGAHRVLQGRISLGVLLVFLSYLGSLYKPVKALSKLSTLVSKGSAATERVVALLDEVPQVTSAPGARKLPALRGAITLDDVSFDYGREPVLNAVQLAIEPGETMALVGPTGAGKSTIASLVPRLVDPVTGRVLVDGIDVRSVVLASLRSQVSMVLQDTILLHGTLRDNIAAGRPGASAGDVERAGRLALVDEFAGRLPDGLDTVIGERGANLSGGQRQRVAIARAVLRDCPILVLDEPTSALDAASEELLVAALDNLPAGRTTLVIAHRLSTVRRADRITVLEAGRVVQQGSHGDLMKVEGLYRRLSTMQSTNVVPLASAAPPPELRDELFDPLHRRTRRRAHQGTAG